MPFLAYFFSNCPGLNKTVSQDFFHFIPDETGKAHNLLNELTESFWNWKLREFPESATKEKFHDHDDEVESYTMEAFTLRKVKFHIVIF